MPHPADPRGVGIKGRLSGDLPRVSTVAGEVGRDILGTVAMSRRVRAFGAGALRIRSSPRRRTQRVDAKSGR
jgi:hypothetical protein